jgi:hypothetical protein
MIGGDSTAATGHVLKLDGGISRNMLNEKRNEGFCSQVTHPAGTGPDDESNRLALVKRRLRKNSAVPKPGEQ